MARSTFKVTYTNSEGLQDKLSSFLQQKGYKNITENNERVWKCGSGFLTAMKYIKIEFSENNTLHISAWIRPILGNEQDLNGLLAALPKKQVMDVVKEIHSLVR